MYGEDSNEVSSMLCMLDSHRVLILLRTEKTQVQTAVLQLEVCQYIENKYGVRGPRKT